MAILFIHHFRPGENGRISSSIFAGRPTYRIRGKREFRIVFIILTNVIGTVYLLSQKRKNQQMIVIIQN
jgi:hypothetical protein